MTDIVEEFIDELEYMEDDDIEDVLESISQTHPEVLESWLGDHGYL